jgi:hypothetical protein
MLHGCFPICVRLRAPPGRGRWRVAPASWLVWTAALAPPEKFALFALFALFACLGVAGMAGTRRLCSLLSSDLFPIPRPMAGTRWLCSLPNRPVRTPIQRRPSGHSLLIRECTFQLSVYSASSLQSV